MSLWNKLLYLVPSIRRASDRDMEEELEYRVILVSDALAGHAHGLHEATLATFYRIFGDVRPSEEVVRLLQLGVGQREEPTINAGWERQ